MTGLQTDYGAALREFETELLLLVNERLHETGTITPELYAKAKELLRGG